MKTQTRAMSCWDWHHQNTLVSLVITLKNKLLARMDNMTISLQAECLKTLFFYVLDTQWMLSWFWWAFLFWLLISQSFLLCINSSVDWVVASAEPNRVCSVAHLNWVWGCHEVCRFRKLTILVYPEMMTY